MTDKGENSKMKSGNVAKILISPSKYVQGA
jgi:hypothetical protein